MLPLELRVVPSLEAAGRQAADATRLLAAGDHTAAERLYREAIGAHPIHASSWLNLAALGVGVGDAAGACAHARQALRLERDNADAWVNFAAASWHAGQRRDAARAMQQALDLAPGLETAALNLSLMFRAVQQPEQARAVLAKSLLHAPGSARLHQAMAELCRVLQRHAEARTHVLAALSAWIPTLVPVPGADAGPEPEDPQAQARLLATMTDACDRLQSAGVAVHLVGGVVLGIVRQGRPFAGDKDIDFGVDFEADRAEVAALFVDGYTRMQVADPAAAERWCLGFVHDATGIGVDLFFKQRIAGNLRICLGWPDDLYYDVPDYRIEPFQWQGRGWPMPAPLEPYLVADYGVDWRAPQREVAGHVFDKRWYDSQISSPSLAPESLLCAQNLVLLRVLAAIRQGRWPKVLALCDQLHAVQPRAEVAALRARLLEAGIR